MRQHVDAPDDTPDDAAWIIKKVLGAKLWDGDGGAWKNSVVDLDGEVLCGTCCFGSALA